MPKSICNFCYEKLIKFNEFKNNCIQSHNSLLNNKWMQLEENYVGNTDDNKTINNIENLYLEPKKEFEEITTLDTFESKSTQHFEDSHNDFIGKCISLNLSILKWTNTSMVIIDVK